MEQEGFIRTITSDPPDSKTYRLPKAEYNYTGMITRADALNKTEKAATKTGKTYLLLVTGNNWIFISWF
jgi:hypothetical protein